MKTSGNVVISGTAFDGNCYIIADGNITYNVNDFKSSGRVVLYSRNGNITINGTNIDVNGILYAPNGTVAFNSNISNINGRIFADKINFSGSIFNVNGSDSDWELLGRQAVVAKTYTFDEDFNEGEFDGLGLDIADELTLEQRADSVNKSAENEYKDNDAANGIALSVKTDKSVLADENETVNVEFDLNGFGSQEVEENNVDLAIVVDTSGSMKNARRNNAVSAAKEVVSKMKPGDRCAIIKFTTGATVLQGFTDDTDLLNNAIDNLNANGGTNIATGINKAVELFDETDSDSRQKYIILMSDGEDSSASAKAATNAFDKGITICALAIGSNSSQMETIANNTNGYYRNSPTAEQIGEMMNMFADVVFNNAGTDVTFTATLNRNINADIENMTPAPAEIIENENGTKTLKWTFDKITIDQSKKISFPISINGTEAGLNSIVSDISCTYYNRAGVSNTVYADDIILPSHTYKENGSWTTVYDSKTAGTEWRNIYWNGKLCDDSVISVMAQTGDDLDAFGDWTEIINHKDITDLKGRYIRVKVDMSVSSSGKTPELYDITLLSDGADKVNYVNNTPVVSISGNSTTSVSKKITLISSAEDDAYSSQLSFNWSCDNENVQIFGSDKPYASFKFNESGVYDITLSVSDDSSTSVITKTITVLSDDVIIKPMIDIEVPSIVKSGAEVSGRIINLNDAEISDFEVLVSGSPVNVSSDGQFSFIVPDSDAVIAVEVKAFNIVGVSGTADKSIIVDGNAPTAELKADSEEVYVNDIVTITAFIDDENGISDYSLTLDGETVSLDPNYQFSFVPTAIGAYTFELNVTDTAGHSSSANLTINAVEGKSQPVVNYSIPRVIMLGEAGDFKFVSDSDTEITVKVNGDAVQLDNDGKFSYTPDAVGDLTIDIHATNGGNTDTDFTLTVPVVKLELVSDKTTYSDEELVTVKLVYSDNLTISNQTATIDNVEYVISNDTIQADRLDDGSHEVVWYAEDENGNIFTGTMAIAVQDMTPPEIEVTLSENALKSGDSVEATISATDRYGINSISAEFDNTNVAVSNNKVVLDSLTTGTHVLSVTAIDNNDVSATYNYEFTVSAGDTTPPELNVSVTVGENHRIEITASASDDSGNAEITGTVNGNKLTFDDGTAYYDPDGYGTFEIVIRAEDATGNYTEKTQTVTISEQIKEYELKLSIGLDKNNVKPNETVNISVRTNTLLEEVTVSCTADGGKLTQAEGGYTFVSDKEGTFKIVVTAADESGNSVSETVYITVSKEQQIIDDNEGEGEYENTYTPEPKARVILNSNEKTETKMTAEMADLADHLKTPLAVYEYLYNNVNVEFYTGSRKGAIGTYEQNGGNDVDCASLFIAMLRYLGYDAEYVTGTIGVTEKQLLELTGTDSVENALNIVGIHFTPISKSSNYYCYTHTWVRTFVNGENYDLDISFKKYKSVLSLNDAAEFARKKYNTDDLLSFSDMNAYKAVFSDDDFADPDSEFAFSGRAIVQKSIKNLPNNPNYIKIEEKEIVSNICDSKVILTDKVKFSIGGESKEYYAPYLYVNDFTIGYTFNPHDLELMEMLEFPHPNSVYGLINAYYITGVRFDASPAIYINNKINYTWNEATSVVDSNDLKITVFSSGITLEYEKTIDCGSINAFQFDFQNISPQEIMTSYANMPSEDVIGNIDTTKFRDSDCLKNYLTLMGAMYFSEFDIQNKLISSSLDVRQEKLLSFGVFTYNADVKAAKESDYGATFDETGSIEVDILDNTYIHRSYTGNKEDENSFHFLSGLASSYLESEIVEQFTGESAVSTVSVLETAMDMDVPIVCINSQNVNKLNNLRLYDEDKAIIRQAVSTGSYVTVPERNITIDSWTGTGYIIQNDDTGDLTFKISGALNGGATPNKATQDALKKYALICGSVAFVDTVSALYSSVMMMSNAVMSLMFASSTLGVVGSVAVIGASIALMNAAMKSYQAAIQNCFLVLEGNPDAAMELLIDTELTLIVNVLGELGGITASAIKNKIAKNYIKSSLPEELVPEIYKAFEGSEESVAKFMKTAKNAGIKDTDSLIKLLRDSGCIDNYPKKVLKQLGKLEKEAQWAIIDGIEKCSKDLPDILKSLNKDGLENFFKAVSKDTDEVFEQLSKISDTEKAVEFIAKYDDGAAYIVARGDYAIESYKVGKTIVEAEKNFVDNLFQTKCNTHFNNVESFNKKRQGIVGGHTLQAVEDYSNNVRQIDITNKTKIYDGIYNIEYKAVSITAQGTPIYKTVDGVKQLQYVRDGFVFEKTVVDLNEITYSEIEKMAKEAFFNQPIITVNGELYIKGTTSGGIKFEGWLENGELKSFYPVKDWQY